MKIAMIGLGRVALADALALGRVHEVVLTGPVPDRVDAINRAEFDLNDPMIGDYLNRYALSVRATLDTAQVLDGASLVMVSAPLSLDPAKDSLHMVELESRIEFVLRRCPDVPLVIRSAVPVGFTEAQQRRFPAAQIVYAPEFSREGAALRDVLYPSFAIVGDRGVLGTKVARILATGALIDDIPLRQVGPSEAEAIRHLSILFQAARVSYFNELDSYALTHGLNARQIIDGVCLDPRIGRHHNNPCFGYGGPNLTRAVRTLTDPFALADAAILSNLAQSRDARITVLANHIAQRGARKVGIYLATGVTDPDQPILRLQEVLHAFGLETHLHVVGAGDLQKFKEESDCIVAQRLTPELADIRDKLFTRDHFAA